MYLTQTWYTRSMAYRVTTEARKWIGTPFHHQGRAMGAGVDCLGLVVCVFNSLGARIVDQESYSRYPTGGHLLAGMREQFTEVGPQQRKPSDIIVMAERAHANHVMILTESGTVIHSYFRNRSVVEQPLKLFENKIVGVFRYEW